MVFSVFFSRVLAHGSYSLKAITALNMVTSLIKNNHVNVYALNMESLILLMDPM